MGRIIFRKLPPRLRWLHTFGMYVEGAMLYLFWLLVRPLSPERASATGRALISRLGPKTHKHKQVKCNLEKAFPALNNEQRESLAREIWGNFGAVMAEYPHLHTLTSGGAPPYINVVIDKDTREILEKKQPAIYVTAHLGNWELVGSIIANYEVPLSVIYGPQRNPLLERMIKHKRYSVGIQLIEKDNGIRQLVREIRAGRSVGLLPDQRVDTGEVVPFFGSDALTTTSPARLALKLNCPLIPVQIERTGNARFRAVFYPPMIINEQKNGQEEPLQLTEDLNRLFEEWIRNQPGQWVCMKRRWQSDACRMTSQRDMPCV